MKSKDCGDAGTETSPQQRVSSSMLVFTCGKGKRCPNLTHGEILPRDGPNMRRKKRQVDVVLTLPGAVGQVSTPRLTHTHPKSQTSAINVSPRFRWHQWGTKMILSSDKSTCAHWRVCKGENDLTQPSGSPDAAGCIPGFSSDIPAQCGSHVRLWLCHRWGGGSIRGEKAKGHDPQ